MQEWLAYGEHDGTKLVAVPYGDGALKMVIFLPQDSSRLEHLESVFDGAWMDAALRRLSNRLVDLTIPKFSTTRRTSLAQALSRMGMPLAFDEKKADFSGMDGGTDPVGRLFIDDVVHKAYVGVDEEGTEAAAATAVMMAVPVSCCYQPPQPVPFRADHPFLYLISDKANNVLFMGRLIDPSKNE
jgi:serpin B